MTDGKGARLNRGVRVSGGRLILPLTNEFCGSYFSCHNPSLVVKIMKWKRYSKGGDFKRRGIRMRCRQCGSWMRFVSLGTLDRAGKKVRGKVTLFVAPCGHRRIINRW